MQRIRWAAAILLLMAVAAGCAGRTPTAPAPPQATPPTEAAPTAPDPAPPRDLREQALARMGAGDLEGAVPLWREAIAQNPTADNWNDLSYTFLLLRRWEDAGTAAEEALKLQREHPGALYNLGIAELELKQIDSALDHLGATARLQPDRYEPPLALARAHAEQGAYALARYYLAQAERLKGPPGEIEPVRAQVARLTESGLPAPERCTVTHEEPPFSLCFTGKDSFAITDLYVGRKGAGQTRISLGTIAVTGRIVKVALPNGFTGFLVAGGETGAYVSGSVKWRLFAISGDTVHQVIFTGNQENFLAPVSDHLRSSGSPAVEGDRLLSSYGSDASREAGAVAVTRQLLPDHTAITLTVDRIPNPDK